MPRKTIKSELRLLLSEGWKLYKQQFGDKRPRHIPESTEGSFEQFVAQSWDIYYSAWFNKVSAVLGQPSIPEQYLFKFQKLNLPQSHTYTIANRFEYHLNRLDEIIDSIGGYGEIEYNPNSAEVRLEKQFENLLIYIGGKPYLLHRFKLGSNQEQSVDYLLNAKPNSLVEPTDIAKEIEVVRLGDVSEMLRKSNIKGILRHYFVLSKDKKVGLRTTAIIPNLSLKEILPSLSEFEAD